MASGVTSSKAKDRQAAGAYQKLTPREHVLQRPDSYIGTVQHNSAHFYIYRNGKIEFRTDVICQALAKIVDEILVNSSDRQHEDASMKNIRVTVCEDTGVICIENDGRGIPVVKHHKYNDEWLPQIIFGSYLTSENFDDTQQRLKGGRNGYGAKLTNTWSRWFDLKIVDPERKLQYQQRFSGNMATAGAPKIKGGKSRGLVRVEFLPDYVRLGFPDGKLDKLHADIIRTRVLDISACTPTAVKVHCDGEVVPVKNFKTFCDLIWLSIDPETSAFYTAIGTSMEISAFTSGTPLNLGFVNGIQCSRGTHIDIVLNHLASAIAELHKKSGVTAAHVKRHISLIVKVWVPNPTFSSQIKEQLTLPVKKFGFDVKLPETFVKNVSKAVSSAVISFSQFSQQQVLSKKSKASRQKPVVEKYLGAVHAGRMGRACTLLLTEGDSAKALAVAGFSVVGRELYGVYPLRGKVLNTRKASPKDIVGCKEVMNVMKILGLEYGKVYTRETISSLRYKKLCIFTDQDLDGHHIAGLIINFVQHMFPSVLQLIPDFIIKFSTPIVKVTCPNKAVVSFDSEAEFGEWQRTAPGWPNRYGVKYYKGLGTSTTTEAKEYFRGWSERVHPLVRVDDADDDRLDMAFNEKRSGDRKQWLSGYNQIDPPVLQYDDRGCASISRFIDTELIAFSNKDNCRSIPSAIDGLKVVQRKVLYAAFKRNIQKGMRVSTMAGVVTEEAVYHHGETSLHEAIVKLAQDYVGTNNMNWLVPDGQFGCRLGDRKIHAAPRYLNTQLSEWVRLVFSAEDDGVLNYLFDDGKKTEPNYYVPILSTLLVNGASGLGTGWSTDIPRYSPVEIVNILISWLTGTEAGVAPNFQVLENRAASLRPWSHFFSGTVSAGEKEGTFKLSGCWKRTANGIHITELPPEAWLDNYIQKVVTPLSEKGLIKDYDNYSTVSSVDLQIVCNMDELDQYSDEDIEKTFKLTSLESTTNMHAFDKDGKLRQYTVPGIVSAHARVRMELYAKRKAHILSRLEADLKKLRNKCRFINEIVSRSIKLEDLQKSKASLVVLLENRIYDALPTYDYLTSMPIHSLTEDELQRLTAQCEKLSSEVDAVHAMDERAMWVKDLETLRGALEKSYTNEIEDKTTRKRKDSGNYEITFIKKSKK